MSQDDVLQQAVMAELSWEPSIDGAHIGVTADEGVVTLSGHVESFPQKHMAEEAARRVKGVKGVVEEIEVRVPFERQRDDNDIAVAALDRLAWDVSVPRDRFTVQVEKGWLTLSGDADWYYQKVAADEDLRRLHGVVGISNQIVVKPRVNAMGLRDDIIHALHRSWFFDKNTITVTTEGGAVRLSGTVHSPHDRNTAAMTAWGAPGATSVENDIVVVTPGAAT